MKLRRAMVTAAATAVVAQLALVSAPVAVAAESPSPSASSSTGTDGSLSAENQSTPSNEKSTPSDQQNTPSDAQSTPSDEQSTSSDEKSSSSDGQSTPTTQGVAPSKSAGSDEWTPDECDEYNIDDNLAVTVKGLPNKIVAGSGWHDFTFSVKNNSDADLKNVWVNTFTEYADDVNMDDSLAWDLAQLQYKDPETGKWTDSYQDSYSDGNANDATVATGTFVGIIDAIDKGAKVDMDLRVRIDAKAPAGSSFAMSSAVYAGKGTACNGNGDVYEFTVLKAGSKPADEGDAKPTGDKPTEKPKTDMKPQGGSEQLPVTGKLASTGSSSAVPTIGLVGGVAVVLGAGALFAVRRRKGAGSNAAA